MSEVRVYRRSPDPSGCLCHGEILSNLVLYRLDLSTIGDPELKVVEVTYSYALVLTQSCDLIQDHSSRQQGKPQLPEVLFCQIPTAEQLKAICGGSDIWKRIRQNKDERYHFLEKVAPEYDLSNEGVPELGVDFKRYFTLPTDEVYRRLEVGPTRRRACLCTPFLEHLSSRFAYFLSRVALPRDHVSE